MEKLELKHLAPYLPYGLKVYVYDCEYLLEVEEDPIAEYVICIRETIDNNHKPILRPLSDLTEEEFSFIYENETDYESIEQLVELDAESFLTCCFSYGFWQLLFREHFDVFGLIPKGLAIDINTIE